jgi:hypothetical protein
MRGNLLPMKELSDNALSDLAARVFRQGLIDGRALSFPRDRGAVMLLLPTHERTILHARKLRQVYGAGYDISRGLRLAAAKEG